MTSPAPCVDHLGAKYSSQVARARAWGLNTYTVQKRLDAGWSLSRALTTPPCHSSAPRGVEVMGRVYPSIRGACRALGITARKHVTRRIAAGLSPDEAIRAHLNAMGDVARWRRISAVLDLWRARRTRGAA